MGWSGSLDAGSALGTRITFTPDSPDATPPASNWIDVTTYAGNYACVPFTAPKRGIYRFELFGSGGAQVAMQDSSADGAEAGAAGGAGGKTVGYMLLNAGQTVYIGAGGLCRAAYVSSADGESLDQIAKEDVLFVAGAGGSGGAFADARNNNGYNCKTDAGGVGGGETGGSVNVNTILSGAGGSQSAGGNGANAGAYGVGGNGSYGWSGHYRVYGGRGGDGWYGGGGGTGESTGSEDNGCIAGSGGGGSGYVHADSITVGGRTYSSTTTMGGGAGSNTAGSVSVTYYARADLPIKFDGVTIDRIVFNGQDVVGLIYDGQRIFSEVMKCLKLMAARFGFRAAIPA